MRSARIFRPKSQPGSVDARVVAVLVWTSVGVFFSTPVPFEAVFSMAFVVILPLIIGREVYQRRRRILELEERAEFAERDKAAEAQRAVAEER